MVRALIAEAPLWLRPGGRLLIEMNDAQCGDAAAHGARHGFVTVERRGDDGQTAVLDVRMGPAPVPKA